MERSEENRVLKARVAALESHVDLLQAELVYLDDILMQCGFNEGIKTLKSTVEEVLEEEGQDTQYVHIRKKEDTE